MKNEINRIIKQVKATGQLWEDEDFLPDDSALYNDPLNPPEYHQEDPAYEWKRPNQITSEEPRMLIDENEPAHVKQGILNDVWLLGSLMSLAMHPEKLRNLIWTCDDGEDTIEYGFAVF